MSRLNLIPADMSLLRLALDHREEQRRLTGRAPDLFEVLEQLDRARGLNGLLEPSMHCDCPRCCDLARRQIHERPIHVHSRQCYDDPGPGHGSPSLVCDKVAGEPEDWLN